MNRVWQRGVTLLALYALALHSILLGLLPVRAGEFGPIDPFAVICYTISASVAPGQTPRGSIKYIPWRAGDFCNVCGAAVPPPAPDVAFHIEFQSARILHVLRPTPALSRPGLTCDPYVIRGPPFASA